MKPENGTETFSDILKDADGDGLMKTMQNISFLDSVFHFLLTLRSKKSPIIRQGG